MSRLTFLVRSNYINRSRFIQAMTPEMKVYCDTCVYIDALDLNPEKSRDRIRPLSEFAWGFFTKVDKGEYVLVTSDWVFEEFSRVVGSDEQLKTLLAGIKNKIHVEKTSRDVAEARKITKNNTADAIHVILAKKAGAFILTTRNIRDFAEFEGLIEISLPESL
jgi:predicted nucleic acid-binding protein